MISINADTYGERLAKRVCTEIERLGLIGKLIARYVASRKAIRVGVPAMTGAIDCAIDYPADKEHVGAILEQLHRYAATHGTGSTRAARHVARAA